MAVTGLTCNPPLWRFHSSIVAAISSPPPILNPEAFRSCSWGIHPSLTNKKQTQLRNKRVAAAQVCVFLSLPTVFPADDQVRSTAKSGGDALDGNYQ